MIELLQFYKRSLGWVAGGVVVWALFVPRVLVPFLTSLFGANNWTIKVAELLTAKPVVVGILVAGEWIIRKWAWKIRHPELNFQGEWEGETTFTKVELGPPRAPFSAKYGVRFEQDCLSFAIAPNKGEVFINWGSLAINLADKDTVRYAYWVNYGDPSRFPVRAIGYEEVRVTHRDRRARPEELTGNFYHCSMGFQPVYSGQVTFKRKAG